MLNLDNSLLSRWICNRQVVFVAVRPLGWHGHWKVSVVENLRVEKCVSSPMTFSLSRSILGDKGFR